MDAWIEDPGSGFDWRQALEPRSEGEYPRGRGRQLIKVFAQQLRYDEGGWILHFSV